MAYYFSNRAKDALPLLEMASGWTQGNTNFSYTLAMVYLATHDRDNARRCFARIFRVPEESPQAFILAADLMSQEKYVDDSEAMILEALKKKPDLPLVNYKLGLIALTRGKFSEAANHMLKELETNPGHSNAWHYLGDAYLKMGKIDEAAEPLQRAIWLNLESTKSYILLASVYAQQNRLFVAENTLKRAVDMEPRNYEAHFQLARIYYKTNRPELAKKEMARANELR
jgi:superkiller protein 3